MSLAFAPFPPATSSTERSKPLRKGSSVAEHAKWEAVCADENKIDSIVDTNKIGKNSSGVDVIAAELATRAVALRESFVRVNYGTSEALALMERLQREWRLVFDRLVLAAAPSSPQKSE